LAPRGVTGLFRRNALFAQLLLAHSKMKLQLIVQVAVNLAAPDQRL